MRRGCDVVGRHRRGNGFPAPRAPRRVAVGARPYLEAAAGRPGTVGRGGRPSEGDGTPATAVPGIAAAAPAGTDRVAGCAVSRHRDRRPHVPDEPAPVKPLVARAGAR